jgi:hypothetical protein
MSAIKDRSGKLLKARRDVDLEENTQKLNITCTFHESRRIRWVGNVAPMGEMRNVYKNLF